MENPKYKIGDKVVPITKTAGVIKFSDCAIWETACDTSQNYLYVVAINSSYYTCNNSNKTTSGNLYNEADLMYYVEPVATPVADITPQGKTVAEEAQSLVYGDREKDYGKTSDNFADIAKGWEVIFKTKITSEQVGLAMGWLKICRANQDNCEKRDSIVDCIGYMLCIEKIKKGL